MVFNATFNNISVIWWQSVLLEEDTGVPGENHRPVESHIMLYDYILPWTGFELTTLVVIGTDWKMSVIMAAKNYFLNKNIPEEFINSTYLFILISICVFSFIGFH